jgi:hypothetical protein
VGAANDNSRKNYTRTKPKRGAPPPRRIIETWEIDSNLSPDSVEGRRPVGYF